MFVVPFCPGTQADEKESAEAIRPSDNFGRSIGCARFSVVVPIVEDRKARPAFQQDLAPPKIEKRRNHFRALGSIV